MTLAGRDLTIGYSDHVVGRDLNVALATGEVLALLGPNGGGKTTLLKTLLGILTPQAGEVMRERLVRMRFADDEVADVVARRDLDDARHVAADRIIGCSGGCGLAAPLAGQVDIEIDVRQIDARHVHVERTAFAVAGVAHGRCGEGEDLVL